MTHATLFALKLGLHRAAREGSGALGVLERAPYPDYLPYVLAVMLTRGNVKQRSISCGGPFRSVGTEKARERESSNTGEIKPLYNSLQVHLYLKQVRARPCVQ